MLHDITLLHDKYYFLGIKKKTYLDDMTLAVFNSPKLGEWRFEHELV